MPRCMFSKAGEFTAILHLVGLFPFDHQLPDNHNSVSPLKHQAKFEADNILFFFYFSEKISLDVSCESSAWHSIHRKWQDYSWLLLSGTRLSWITAYLEVKIWSLPKHENLTTGKKYCGKEEKLLLRSNFSSFPQYFQYISNFRSPITHIFVKCG